MSPTDGAPPKKPVRWERWLVGLALATILLVVAAFVFPFLRAERLYEESKGEYARRKSQYDAIVLKLSTEVAAPNGRQFYFISSDRDPKSLRQLRPEEAEGPRYDFYRQGCLIDAYREQDGSLVVFFVTRDFGAMKGTLGLVYSAVEPKAGQFGLGGRHEKVAPNWWAIWQ